VQQTVVVSPKNRPSRFFFGDLRAALNRSKTLLFKTSRPVEMRSKLLHVARTGQAEIFVATRGRRLREVYVCYQKKPGNENRICWIRRKSPKKEQLT
jgi:hypothetical protein